MLSQDEALYKEYLIIAASQISHNEQLKEFYAAILDRYRLASHEAKEMLKVMNVKKRRRQQRKLAPSNEEIILKVITKCSLNPPPAPESMLCT